MSSDGCAWSLRYCGVGAGRGGGTSVYIIMGARVFTHLGEAEGEKHVCLRFRSIQSICLLYCFFLLSRQ